VHQDLLDLLEQLYLLEQQVYRVRRGLRGFKIPKNRREELVRQEQRVLRELRALRILLEAPIVQSVLLPVPDKE